MWPGCMDLGVALGGIASVPVIPTLRQARAAWAVRGAAADRTQMALDPRAMQTPGPSRLVHYYTWDRALHLHHNYA